MKKSQRHSRYKVHRSRSTTSPKRKRSKSPKRKRSTASRKKKQSEFLFNPNNPDKSFDVYIDKNPKDTISIKYIQHIKMLSKLLKNWKNYINQKNMIIKEYPK